MMEQRIKVAVPFSVKAKKNSFRIFVILFLGVVLFLTYLPIAVIALTSFSTHPSGYEMPGVTMNGTACCLPTAVFIRRLYLHWKLRFYRRFFRRYSELFRPSESMRFRIK